MTTAKDSPPKPRLRIDCPTVPGSKTQDYHEINLHDCWDPYHGLEIDYLIGLEQDHPDTTYVVYLDPGLDVVWCSTNSARKASPGMRAVLGRMGLLESMPIGHLDRPRQEEFRRLLGQGLSFYLSCRSDPDELRNAEAAAFAAFDEAERRINQWNFEHTTRWYALAAVVMLLGAVVAAAAASAAATKSEVTWEFGQFGFAGALGSLLFFLVRLRKSLPGQLRVEVSGTRVGYFATLGTKVVVGVISAVLIGVAMRADLLLGVATKGQTAPMPAPFTISAVAFVVCFVAGFSESLVPRFFGSFERTAGGLGDDGKTPTPPGVGSGQKAGGPKPGPTGPGSVTPPKGDQHVAAEAPAPVTGQVGKRG